MSLISKFCEKTKIPKFWTKRALFDTIEIIWYNRNLRVKTETSSLKDTKESNVMLIIRWIINL